MEPYKGMKNKTTSHLGFHIFSTADRCFLPLYLLKMFIYYVLVEKRFVTWFVNKNWNFLRIIWRL